jgi:hypothetical protein
MASSFFLSSLPSTLGHNVLVGPDSFVDWHGLGSLTHGLGVRKFGLLRQPFANVLHGVVPWAE